MKRSLTLVLVLLATSACALRGPRPPVHVVIVGTTDVHGWFNGHVETPPGGGEGVLWGGLPVLATHVEALREQHGGRVLLVDSGDMFQGTLESNMFEGEAVVRGYNAMGYTAAAVGNHEFDFGPVGPEPIPRKPGDDPLGALKRNAELAMFPMLSANMKEKSTGQTPSWAKPSILVRAGTARIGIIGLSTPDTPAVTMGVNVESLSFTNPVEATVAEARKLRAMGADAVIVIAHIGGRCTDMSDEHSLAKCETQQEAMELLNALPQGTIDAFFAGHTHANMRHYVNGVATVQGLAMSREFSTVDLWIDTRNNRVTKSEMRMPTMICSFVYEGTQSCDPRTAVKGAKLVPRVFNGERMNPDTRVAAVLDPFLRRVASKREQKVGIATTAAFPRVFAAESALGNLLADVLRRSAGADVGIMNSGGIRAELPAGELTYGDVFAVSPFDNYPSLAILTGAQLIELLRSTTTGQRGIMQVSGIRYTYDASKKGLERFVSVVREDGSAIIEDKLYTVIMPDFIAGGGDGAEVMKTVAADRIQTSFASSIRDVLIEQLAGQDKALEPKTEGRIIVLNKPAP
ncbi:MAG TPA: 5'-nucleotidase C-terminal domain-containing protein [Thermoanaerobaculia bacterium]|nr:5'-nucleotidase C-terminal domain-containing protein [Thermoanaerobaculia bacterium]